MTQESGQTADLLVVGAGMLERECNALFEAPRTAVGEPRVG